MDEKYFELLLAMMRLLKREDQAGSSLETAIARLLDSFEPSFDDVQKEALSKEFARYSAKLQKRKTEEETIRKIRIQEYEEIVDSFVHERME